MNIPKKQPASFHTAINIFFSTYLPVYIHKVFNFAFYQQEVNSRPIPGHTSTDNKADRRPADGCAPVHNGLIKQTHGLITYPARKNGFIFQHY